MLSAARNTYEDRMTAEIVQIRDYQSKRAIERAHKELEAEAKKIIQPFIVQNDSWNPAVDTSPCEMAPSGSSLTDQDQLC